MRLPRHARLIRAGTITLLLCLLPGCAAKRHSYRFSGCAVVNTSIDKDGQERKECECRNGKMIGIDVNGDVIVRCD